MHTGTKRWCCGTCGKEHRLRSVSGAVIYVYSDGECTASINNIIHFPWKIKVKIIKWLVISDYHTVEIAVLGLQKINVKLLKSKVLSCSECRFQIVGIAVV